MTLHTLSDRLIKYADVSHSRYQSLRGHQAAALSPNPPKPIPCSLAYPSYIPFFFFSLAFLFIFPSFSFLFHFPSLPHFFLKTKSLRDRSLSNIKLLYCGSAHRVAVLQMTTVWPFLAAS